MGYFFTKILRNGSHFGQKLQKKKKKKMKSAVFEVEKSLDMGPDLQKFLGGKNMCQISHFLSEKHP